MGSYHPLGPMTPNRGISRSPKVPYFAESEKSADVGRYSFEGQMSFCRVVYHRIS